MKENVDLLKSLVKQGNVESGHIQNERFYFQVIAVNGKINIIFVRIV